MAYEAAAAWLAGEPGAADRAAELADYATHAGQAAELVDALLDALGITAGSAAGCQRAVKRLSARADAINAAVVDGAVDRGRWRALEGK